LAQSRKGALTQVIFEDIDLSDRPILKIVLDVNDALACDNTVYLMPPQKDTINVALIGQDSSVLRKTLMAIPKLNLDYLPVYNEGGGESGEYDIYIYHETTVPSRPLSNVIIINGRTETSLSPLWEFKGEVVDFSVTRIDTTWPVLKYCQTEIFTNIPRAINLSPRNKAHLKPIIQARLDGAQNSADDNFILIGECRFAPSSAGLTIKQKGGDRVILINFPIEWRSEYYPEDWTLTPTFPIFWTNLINYLISSSHTMSNDYFYYRTTEMDIPLKMVGLHYLSSSVHGSHHLVKEGMSDKTVIGINLCNEEESDNNGITLIESSISFANRTRQENTIETKRASLDYWLVSIAVILVLLSWLLSGGMGKYKN
ncbi:MAG: hypothetical protein QME16_04850, partial [Planctomycetota bacterium]|nr:hypothetical protein [Planctomycetota bacterium]